MKLAIDNFVLGEESDKYDIVSLAGLGSSDIRTSQFNFSGRDGGLVTSQFRGMRAITVTGVIRSTTCDDHVTDRVNLTEALPINQLLPLYFTLFNGDQYVIYANVMSASLDYRPGGLYSDYKIDFLAGDPLFYSTDGGTDHTATINKAVEGGYVTPYVLPVSWDAGSPATTVLNSGDSIVYPVITLTGQGLNPEIVNNTSGEIFGLNLSMSVGDVVVIDMGNRTVTLNGSNILGNKTDESNWWGLAVGSNSISLNSDTTSDTVSALVVWRNGRSGI